MTLTNPAISLAAEPIQRTEHSQPSIVLSNPQVELAVTQLGGHLAPVTFYRDSSKSVQPYYISPWQDEPSTPMPVPVLVPLRGDFFCLPFGGNQDAVAGEKHSPHGETAGSQWLNPIVQRHGAVNTLTMTLNTQVRKGKVTKELSLVDGQNVVYVRHKIEGFAGRAPLGHHATLAMPDEEGTVRIATSPVRFGMTCPGLFADPKQREYQSLLPGSRWTDLSKVPMAWKGQPDADLTRLPARVGHADLVQLINEPSEKTGSPAWTTATFSEAGYLWFAFKDPAVLASTVIWIENHGRHGHPWNGRNNCVGLEDVTAYFADGLSASITDNLLTKEGVTTALELKADRPTIVNYVQGVVKILAEFDIVKNIEFSPDQATFVAANGKRVSAKVHHNFVKSGELPQRGSSLLERYVSAKARHPISWTCKSTVQERTTAATDPVVTISKKEGKKSSDHSYNEMNADFDGARTRSAPSFESLRKGHSHDSPTYNFRLSVHGCVQFCRRQPRCFRWGLRLGPLGLDGWSESTGQCHGQRLRRLLRPQESVREQLRRPTIHESDRFHRSSPAAPTDAARLASVSTLDDFHDPGTVAGTILCAVCQAVTEFLLSFLIRSIYLLKFG